MHKHILLALLTASALVLAGCSGNGGGKPPEDPTQDLGLEATETTGIIRGVVVDERIVPLAGAKITLAGVGSTTTSNDQGAFGFQDLEPGTYFLEVAKLGFKAVQQSAEVVAGVDEPGIVRVLMAADPQALPSYEIFHFQGYLECNLVAGFFFVPCTDPLTGEPVGNDQFEAMYPIQGNASFIHVSLVWDATQAVGTELYFNVCDVDTFCESLDDIQAYSGGPNPIVADLNATMLDEINPSGGVGIQVSGNGEGATENLAGASVKQAFDAFIVVFYNFEPVEGYAYHRDGAPTLPS